MASGSGNDSSNDASQSMASSSNSSRSSSSTATETAYCVRTINYMISTLRLPIPQLNTLGDLSMEVLVRIHCALLGISFSNEFIPSVHPKEDVERMILSLKDRFGKDQFSALEANKIAERNPTQLRFLLENFHLILNHQLAKSKSRKSRAMALATSRSGNHLSVREPSDTNIRQDSFYVLPHQLDEGETYDSSLGHTTFNSTDDSFQTVENVKLNVFEDTTSDESTRDPLFIKGVDPDDSYITNQSQSMHEKKLLTSSPVVSDAKISKSHQSPNVSSIRPSRSALNNLQQTPSNPNYRKPPPLSQSLQRGSAREMKDSRVNKPQNEKVKLSAKKDTGKIPFSSTAASQTGKNNETQFMSDDSGGSCDSIQVLKKVSDIHAKIRNQISESVMCLDDDMSKLKRKPPKPNANNPTCSRKPLPNLRWMMPVDSRFPEYRKGIIVPKCTSWRSNLKTSTKHCTPKKSHGARKPWSNIVQKGSRPEEQELFLYE